MGVYDRQVAGALRQIAAKGEVITWYRRGDPVGNPAKPTERPRAGSPARMVFFPSDRTSYPRSQSVIEGTEVRAGGVMGYMGAEGFEPLNGDTVIRASGQKLTVQLKDGIEVIAPNGEVILYTVYFER